MTCAGAANGLDAGRKGLSPQGIAAYRRAMVRTSLPLSFRAELAATVRLSTPLAVANLLQMAVYASDVMFISRLGARPLAASSLAVAIIALLMMGLNGLTGAVAPLIAAELGRRRHAVREVRRSVRMALWLAVGLGALCTGICLMGGPIMRATGQDPQVTALAARFLAVLSISVIPMAVGNVLRTFVSALGRPVFATVITGLEILTNVVGNYALVFGHFGLPAMGLDGAAASSISTAAITVVAYAVAIRADRRLRRYRIFGRWWRSEWPRARQMLALGLPIAATLMAEGGLFSAASFLMGRMGDVQLAAHAIALQIASFAFMVPFGVGQAATIRVGYAFGAGSRIGVTRAGWASVAIGMVFMVLSAGLMLLAPEWIVSAYLDPHAPGNAMLVHFALQFLFVAAIFQLSDGLQAVVAGVLRGVHDTRMPFVIALLGYWVAGFGTSAVLAFWTPLGGRGVWIGLAVGLTVAAALLLVRWMRRDRIVAWDEVTSPRGPGAQTLPEPQVPAPEFTPA